MAQKATPQQRQKAIEINEEFRKIIKQLHDGFPDYAHWKQWTFNQQVSAAADRMITLFARRLTLMPPEFNRDLAIRAELHEIMMDATGLSYEDGVLMWFGWFLALSELTKDERRIAKGKPGQYLDEKMGWWWGD